MSEIFIYLQYIALGLIQGLTEPLPISSSGHLVIAQHFWGLHVPDLHFEVFLNGASLVAVFIVYRRDIWDIVKDLRASAKFIFHLVIATLPAVVIGGLFAGFIGGKLTTLTTVAVALIITGIALWLVRKLSGEKSERDMKLKDALIIGFAQAIALAPGISRSGATVVAALGVGLNRETALKFSFFMSIPVGIAALALKLPEIYSAVTVGGMWGLYTVSFIAALLSSYFVIKLFINLVLEGKLIYLSAYCITVATLVLLFK
ncbi:undecaprenyl-diphosphatase [Desulfitispora alkaliphila]|uniref:undecaprenyl-diphosphate phosphatase n=1 Tax=Desulfitispora alkaliphila TaxID=622674 RepID=UPI003D20212F